MIMVSEKPVFANYLPIPIGSDVYIIDTQYVKFNPITFGEEVQDIDEVHFLTGILVSKNDGTYTVRIHANEEIIRFNECPREFFFRKIQE